MVWPRPEGIVILPGRQSAISAGCARSSRPPPGEQWLQRPAQQPSQRRGQFPKAGTARFPAWLSTWAGQAALLPAATGEGRSLCPANLKLPREHEKPRLCPAGDTGKRRGGKLESGTKRGWCRFLANLVRLSGRSDRRPSPWPRPPQTRQRTAFPRHRWHRLQPRRAVRNWRQRSGLPASRHAEVRRSCGRTR